MCIDGVVGGKGRRGEGRAGGGVGRWVSYGLNEQVKGYVEKSSWISTYFFIDKL